MAERVAVACRVVALLAWCLLVLAVVLAFRGPDSASTWVTRAVMLSLAALVTVGFIVLARRRFRTAMARPLPGRGVSGWFVRQPGWALALMLWAAQFVVAGGVALGVAGFLHRSPPFGIFLAIAVGLSFQAVWQAAEARVRFQRQARATDCGARRLRGVALPGCAVQ